MTAKHGENGRRGERPSGRPGGPRPRIYLAGFDVFRPDAIARGRQLQAWCEAAGFEGVYPLDAAVPDALDGPGKAAWIYRANVEALRASDIVMANVDDFRGPGEPDSGTAFEIGYAAALGKALWAYTTDAGTLLERVPSAPHAGGRICARGFLVEDFGLSKNLMIACSARIVRGDAQACLAAIAADWRDGASPARAGQ
ncbi:nucleoside 2-deoxyribosyltransferase [Burkholderia sp. WAC0059]|uniref:nucleoside 2-deoxyribosyltransferase n=1 Tax=Burkholderia sp. WAC0059 TaxID=2066022 RepID=UPI000C7F38EA|nr:nucleoside 2-deoxyribosyltransferase [Burkholderia sp. WAC0059]PLZ04272.1 nucleoside 2-deoxyribosyltransferase [Burkholderia sp. WAC0059]